MKPSIYLTKNYPNEKKRVQLVNKIIDYFLSDEDIINYENLKNGNISTIKKKVAKNGSNQA